MASLNESDGNNRNFILVEMEGKTAKEITSERLRRLNIPFRYCTLGEPLFTAEGMISGEVTRERLAHHIWFTETGEPLPYPVGEGSLVGVHHGTAILFLEGALTVASLRTLPPHDGPRVVYANACRLSTERLAAEGLVFKAVPYDVRDA